MRFRQGTAGQKALFFTLVGIYVLALALRFGHDVRFMDEPNLGFYFTFEQSDTWRISGLGRQASDKGLKWGAELVSFNNVPAADLVRDTGPADYWGHPLPRDLINTKLGEANKIKFRSNAGWAAGAVQTAELTVKNFAPGDIMCASGIPLILGLVFVVVGVGSFVVRPFTHAAWALLMECVLFGAFVSLVFRLADYGPLTNLYFIAVASLFALAPLYLGLAMVAPHPVLHHHRRLPLLIFSPALLLVAYGALTIGDSWRTFDITISGILLVTLLFSLARACNFAVRGEDPLVRQRAHVVLLGCLGFIPPTVIWFAQVNYQVLMLDMRQVIVTVLTFPIALAYITVRHELFSMKVAVRRSAIYTVAVVLFVAEAAILTAVLSGALGAATRQWVTPIVMAVVLLPVLHYWPRFNDRLNRWLYPKRTHFPELMQELGEDMASCTTKEAILGVLATAPRKVCDANRGVAFLLPDGPNETQRVNICCEVDPASVPDLTDSALIQLLVATRHPVTRGAIAVEPQYANIKAECYATLDKLGVDIILPIVRENRVIGGLGVGPRETGDVFDPAELNVLRMLTQQTVQAFMRTEAFDTLQARQEDIARLKHYLQPHVVDEVMEKGARAALGSTERKIVTVFFSDLRGFTAFADSVEPEEVMAILAEYHEAMGLRIAQFGGTLERFVGDGIMVYFNDPVEQEDHVQRATRMALAMRDDVLQLRENWVRKGYHLHVGMGIHTGYATCGIVGYEGRRDYAVIGTVTNMAARFCDAAAGGEILVSARVISELGTAFPNEPVGELTLKGFHQPQITYRILGARTHV